MKFFQSFKPISISLSPNTQRDDTWLASKLLFQLWRWKKGKEISLLEDAMKKYLGVRFAFSFNSGRSSFLALLHSLNLHENDEILVQAFTCNAVPNPVLWAGLKPVYVDCTDDFNMDPQDLERKITPKSKAVVVQHTFGLPANLEKIQEVCGKYNLILLEDCAHALGASYKGRKVGTFGRAAFFSFSRDKVISSVYGGMAATNDEYLAQRMKEYQETAGFPSLFWTKQQLLHPLFMNLIILPTYRILGKYLLVLLQWIGLLSKAVHWKEKKGKRPGYFPKRLPNALAVLALCQTKKLDRFNAHRKEVAALYAKELANTEYQILNTKYQEGNIFLRFPVRHPKAHEILRKAWDRNLLLGDWYTTPVAPRDTQIDKMGYEWGSCPVAEELAKTTLNLPTHIRISKKEAGIIVGFLRRNQV